MIKSGYIYALFDKTEEYPQYVPCGGSEALVPLLLQTRFTGAVKYDILPTMKKIVLCLFALVACLSVSAQNGRAFGVRAGLNVTNLHLSESGVSMSLTSRASFHAGFAYQQPLMRLLPLYFETGLYVTGRGASISADEFGFDSSAKLKFNMLYLQVPALVSWHFNLRSVSIQPAVGVYYGFGMHGKAKAAGEKVELFKSVDLGEGAEQGAAFKRSDLGLRFGLGVAVKHYFVGAGYDLGLLNIAKESDGGKIRNGSFYISLGYNF